MNDGYYRVLQNTSTPVDNYYVKSNILEQNFLRFKWAAVKLLKIHSIFSTPSLFLHIGVLLMLAQFDLRLCCFRLRFKVGETRGERKRLSKYLYAPVNF